MKMLLSTRLIILLTLTGAASAEVTDSAEGGFTTVNEVVIAADRAAVWQQSIGEVGLWWSSDHTISGDASRLSINAVAQGCFCESLGDGADVVHLTVTMVNPGVIIRLTGGLGPLGLMGVAGNMTWEYEDVEDGTLLKFTYAVGGYRAGGLDEIAGPVDGVVGAALSRLKRHVETGSAQASDID